MDMREAVKEGRQRFGNQPAELKAVDQWIARGTDTDVLVNPHTGLQASVWESHTWSTFDHAAAVAVGAGLPGVGFVLAEADPYMGIHLGGCRNPLTSAVDDWALAIVARFPRAFWEVHPNSTGVQGIMKGRLPPGGRVRKFGLNKRLTLYDRGWAFLFTGSFFRAFEKVDLSPQD